MYFFYMPLPEVPIIVEGSVYKAWLNLTLGSICLQGSIEFKVNEY